jgi:hypothetical protein
LRPSWFKSSFVAIDESGRRGAAESISRVSAQGVDIKVLDGKAVGGMIAVHAAAALSFAEVNPV